MRLVGLLLFLTLLLSAACGGGGSDGSGSPTLDPTPTAGGGEQLGTGSPPATATGGTPGAEAPGAAGFRAFARVLNAAAASRDATFIQERLRTQSVVCEQDDVGAGPGGPLCDFEGQAYDGFPVAFWQSDGAIVPLADAMAEFSRAFVSFQPQAVDDFGDGNVRVYALNVEDGEFDALITMISSRPPDDGEGDPLRVVLGTSWEFLDGRWLMTDLLVAFGASEDLLEPSQDVLDELYPGWERYEAP